MKKSKSHTSSERDPYFLRKKPDSTKMASKTREAASKASEAATKADMAELTNTIVSRFDGLAANVATIKKDITELRNGLEDLKATTIDSSARINDLEQSIPALKNERLKAEKELREAILAMDIHNRKQNLLIYGIAKEAGENVQRKVRDVIGNLGLSGEVVTNMSLINAHRLPRRYPGPPGEERGPDPLIVRFGTMFDRDLVLRQYQQKQRDLMVAARENRDAQNRLPFRLLIDLPPLLKRRRFELEKCAYRLRKEGNQSTRIRVVGIEVVLEKREKGSTSAWKREVE